MSREAKAQGQFGHGINCSQAVFGAFSDDFDIDKATALNVARAFGGGMGREGHVCGAVTGAIMAIGCMHGTVAEKDEGAARNGAYGDVQEFMRRFEERNGGQVSCRGLLGVDLKAPEGQAEFKEKNMLDTRCRKAVRDAIEILEEMI